VVGAVQEEVCIVIYVCEQTEYAGTVVPVGDKCMTTAVQCMCGVSTVHNVYVCKRACDSACE
jgi:hypothetical protein